MFDYEVHSVTSLALRDFVVNVRVPEARASNSSAAV